MSLKNMKKIYKTSEIFNSNGLALLTYIVSAINIYIKHETIYNKFTWIGLIIATLGLIYGVLTP